MTGGPAYVERLLRAWAAPDGGWPTPDVARRYADAMALPFVAHSAAEYYRWVVRSQVRPDGRRFVRRVQRPVRVPAMYLQGDSDGVVAPSSARGSAAYVSGPYEEHVLAGAGHFLPEEAPDAVTATSPAGSTGSAEHGRRARTCPQARGATTDAPQPRHGHGRSSARGAAAGAHCRGRVPGLPQHRRRLVSVSA